MKQLARLVDIYTMLAPYTKTLVAENAAKGHPGHAALFLQYEDDPRGYTEQFEYLYGPDLLVAPVWQERQDGVGGLPAQRRVDPSVDGRTLRQREPTPFRRNWAIPRCSAAKGSQWAELFDSIRAKYGK